MNTKNTVTMIFAFRKIESVPFWFFPSHAIGRITGGELCHVEGIFPDGLWYGAVGQGQRFTNKISGNKGKWLFVEIELTRSQMTQLRKMCEADRGRKYDYEGLASYILPISQSWSKGYCSELWRDYLGRTGIEVFKFWMGEKCPPDAKGRKYIGLHEMLCDYRDTQKEKGG